MQSRVEAAEIWSRFAETLLDRMGGHDLIWGWLLTNRSALRQIQGRPAEALEDARRAVVAKEKVLGATHPDLGVLAQQRGALPRRSRRGRRRRSSSLARALPIVENGLGADHPRTAWMLSNYSELLNRVGRFAEADEAATRALTILERENDPQGLFITYPLVALGTSALGLGEPRPGPAGARARPRDPPREGARPGAARRGALRAGARAVGGGRRIAPARSRSALTARDEYRLSPDTAARTRALADVEAWLATRAQP